MNKLITFIGCFFLFTSLSAQGNDRLDQRSMDVIDSLSEAMMVNADMVGLGIGVVYENEVTYINTYGWATEDVTPFQANTKVRWASISKTVTGLLVMRLVEEGKCNIEDEIEDYITGWDNSGIKIKHLLAHQSGIGHYIDCGVGGAGYPGPFTPNLSSSIVSNCSICFYPPGSFQRYTTFGSILLGVVVDHIAQVEYGKSFVELSEDWIKTPMNLSSFSTDNWGTDPLMAKGYWGVGSPIPVHEQVGWKLPAGGFYSNIGDLTKYVKGILTYQFVNASTSSDMWTILPLSGTMGSTTGCSDPLSPNSGYGLSFVVTGSGNNLTVSHNGLNGTSCSTEMSIWPNRKMAVVLMTNTTDKNNALRALRNQILNVIDCPAGRAFTNQVDWETPSVYESSNSIELSNTINRLNELILDGNNEVIFKDGFFAPQGSSIQAVNEGCASGPSPY